MIPDLQNFRKLWQADWTTWSDRAVVCAAFALALLMMSYNKADPDLWGHWQYGLDALRFGLPSFATYTYTVGDYPWINHEWISEWLLARTWLAWGAPGLLIGKCLLGLFLLAALFYRIRRAGFGPLAASALMVAVGYNLMLFWKLRPQVLSFALLPLELWLLDRAFGRPAAGPISPPQRPRYRYLFALAPLLAFWTNVHGAFAAGLAIAGVYLTGRALQLLAKDRRAAIGTALGLMAVFALCVASTLVNPYGWELHRWMWESLSKPRPEILEWLPPELWSEVWAPFWIFAAGTVAAHIAAWRRIDWVETTVLAALLWQSCRHHRHVALFVIAAAWWAPYAWRELAMRLRNAPAKETHPSSLAARVILAGALLATIVLGGMTLMRCRSVVVLPRTYPVEAFQFMKDHGLTGRLVVQFRWAQYALAALGNHEDPRGQGGTTVAFDGRFRTCYPQSVVDATFDFLIGDEVPRYRSPESPPADPTRILRMGHPDLVLIDREATVPCQTMRSLSHDWVLLYRDGVAELWGRRTRYDVPGHPDYFLPEHRRIGNTRQDAPVPFPAFPE
ncbi:MAG TPA: hypothetical protein ENJ16_04100, partial [Planctomycetaceae bacterium]|nr:hypothetical protein [Planctomycetaceae bacterium]